MGVAEMEGTMNAGQIPASETMALEVMERIFAGEAMAKHDRANGWFSRYYGWLGREDNRRRYYKAVTNLVGGELLTGKTVLDIGCGFGVTCVLLSLMGATTVHGLDIDSQMLETFQSFLSEIDPPLDIKTHYCGAESLPFPDNALSVVICIEALSHIREPWRALEEAVRVLEPGGMLVIADDNNGANPFVRRKVWEVWDRFENGPPCENIHGHRVTVPYRQRRAQIISECNPETSDSDLAILKEETAYYDRAAVEAAVRRYFVNGERPGSRYHFGTCPVEPYSGQFIENLLNPLELVKHLTKLGLDTEVEAYFGGESRGGMVKRINDLVNFLAPARLIVRISPGFRVRGWKRG